MFAEMGKYEPCGIFSKGHFILIVITILGIIIALKYSNKKSKEEVHRIIKYITIIAWILEVIKIIYTITKNPLSAVNTYLPLYYCSMLLYAGLLSSFGKNSFKRIGDVSLATGGIIGGIVFIIYPSTSLPWYPAFHAFSIHSFLFHGTMIFLGILINKTNYIELKKEDVKYFASLIGIMSIVALIVNNTFDVNLMFISDNFPGTLLEILYNLTNGGILYSLIMIIGQMTLPFYVSYYAVKIINNKKKLKEKKEIITILSILAIQTIVFVIAGANKSYIHMDEAYSLGLASYNKIEIQANEDFYNTWHSKEYYENYLVVNQNEKSNFSQVYENQKNDVHPPLYYLFLRVTMGFHLDTYSKWSGIILNIIIYIFITIFMYLIAKMLLQGSNKYKERSAILALISSLTLSSINNAIYIRMYALATLNIVMTTYFHLKLLNTKEKNTKLLVVIGISALIGSLTHYYYLFYLVMLFIMFVVKYIKDKSYKQLGRYVLTMAIAGIVSLIIFPYSIQHMFFGYRGQGAISNLTNISKFIINICQYILKINIYVFNNVLIIILAIILGLIIYRKTNKIETKKSKNKYIKYIAIPTAFYTVLVAISSPWIELRYIMPVCSLIFILVLYILFEVLQDIVKEKRLNQIVIAIFALMLIMPGLTNCIIDLVIGKEFRNEKEITYSSKIDMCEELKNEIKFPLDIISFFFGLEIDNNTLLMIKDFKIEPEVLYSSKQDIVENIKNNSDLPALYMLDNSNNRFLDDILLFANIKESYIAKDIICNEENIKKIMADKDNSKGILVFINNGQDNEGILETITSSLELENITYLKRLNACDVYLVN